MNPTYVMISVEFDFAFIIKLPSKSVTAPLKESASSIILTPGIGDPLLSVIVPVIISFWAKMLLENPKNIYKDNLMNILNINLIFFKKDG